MNTDPSTEAGRVREELSETIANLRRFRDPLPENARFDLYDRPELPRPKPELRLVGGTDVSEVTDG